MPVALLQTKLYRPAPRPNLVARPNLLERLDRALTDGARLILVSAPPGFGKTTLIADWLAKSNYPAAWVSLDALDNDSSRFLSYVVSALQLVSPGIGESLLGALASPQPPSLDSLLPLLVNDLCGLSQTTLLVLDDYHNIDTPAIHAGLAFLLDHLPSRLHIVITTRVDPPLPLSRYRSRSQLVEIRTDDLRMTADEAALFLNRVMGLNLSAQDIALLQARTEGWLVGLQMAALSIQGRPDPTRFIQAFSGSNRYVLDYLLEEVLGRQSTEMQEFLIQTSILEQMTGPLCDAVTGKTDSQALLEQLEHDNLFLISLDQERRWYRYHHLFRDLLLARLKQLHGKEIPALHLAASDWFEENAFAVEAITHALAAHDYDRAIRVLEQSSRDLVATGLELSTFIRWLKTIPTGVLFRHLALCMRYALALIHTGTLDQGEQLILQVEQHIENQPDPDAPQFREAKIWGARARSLLAAYRGDFKEALDQIVYAFTETAPEDIQASASLMNQVGVMHLMCGHIDEASRWLSEGIPLQSSLHMLPIATDSYCHLADIARDRGQLNRAAELHRLNLKLAEEQGDNPPGTIGIVQAEMGDILREWDRLEEAREWLTRAREHTRRVGKPYDQTVAHDVSVRLCLSEGNMEAARELVREGEIWAQLYGSMLSLVQGIDRVKVRVWLATGDLTSAARWLEAAGITGEMHDDSPEWGKMLLVRLWIAQGHMDGALGLLRRLEQTARAEGRFGNLIAILVLQVVAFSLLNKTREGLHVLHEALTLAEPEGYVRIFADEGEPVRGLLQRIRSDNPDARLREYSARLLLAFGATASDASPSPSANSTLPESLSARELEVLRLVGQGLSNREIADRLVISLPTVKKHVENIHGKLGVKNRSQAILRAQELKLL